MLENDITLEPPPIVSGSRASRRIDASSIFVALLVAAAGAGLYYMHWRTAEATALVLTADADAVSVDTLLSGGRASIQALGKSLHETKTTIAKLTRTPGPVLASTSLGARDPFRFESLEPQPTTATVAAPSNSAREQAKQRLLSAARTLQVQSIMYGSAKRSCLINGKLYFEGQPCGEFTVASITPGSVFVQSSEFRFELRFRK